MTRQFWVVLHRYAGLYLAFFLIVAGVTGSLLAFLREISDLLDPPLMVQVQPGREPLDALSLRERALAIEPRARIHLVFLKVAPDHPQKFYLEPGPVVAGGTGSEDLGQIELDPYTGAELRRRTEEPSWPLTGRNVMQFVYELHYLLALNRVGLGTLGQMLFGVAALVWTLDCFWGAYLTFPLRLRARGAAANTPGASAGDRTFLRRWALAWKVRVRGSAYRLNFDLHRAGGLWVWAMLFVLAWSSVAFNFQTEAYLPVSKAVFSAFGEWSDDDWNRELPRPRLQVPRPDPALSWLEALDVAKRLAAEQSALRHFNVEGEELILYDPARGLFQYVFRSDRDISDHRHTPASGLYFDGDTGAFVQCVLPTGERASTTVTTWLVSLHMASVWGMPFKVFICLMGLVIVMLSVTGVYIWTNKRRARRTSREQREPMAAEC